MKKTLRDYLIEGDQEFTVTVKCRRDVMCPENLPVVQRVLGRFDLRSLEPMPASPLVDSPEEWPDAGLIRVYEFVAKTGLYPHSLAQQLSIEAYEGLPMMPAEWFRATVTPELEVRKPSDTPHVGLGMGDHPDDDIAGYDPAELVGMKRVKDIFDVFSAEREVRDRESADRASKFVSSHVGIRDVLGESRPKGYYECRISDGKMIVESGPHSARPRGRLLIGSEILEMLE